MKIKFYGVRGSTPVSDKEYMKVGGNTASILVEFDNGKIAIIDSGTGVRKIGKDMLERGIEQYDNIFIIISHTHWDHIQGFPFFKPAYDARRHFTFSELGGKGEFSNLKRVFALQMQKDFFPVTIDKMGASFTFSRQGNSNLYDGEIKMNVYKHNHPGGAYSVRIEENGRSFVYASDVEHGENIDQNLVELSKNTDLLIHDSQYTPDELPEKRGWGHSSFEQAAQVADLAKVKQLALFHHDPEHNDDFLYGIEKDAKTIFKDTVLAVEGLEFKL